MLVLLIPPGRKVEALRRCTFRELPPTLIIHLKRFEFNIETMDRKKVRERAIITDFLPTHIHFVYFTYLSSSVLLIPLPSSCFSSILFAPIIYLFSPILLTPFPSSLFPHFFYSLTSLLSPTQTLLISHPLPF